MKKGIFDVSYKHIKKKWNFVKLRVFYDEAIINSNTNSLSKLLIRQNDELKLKYDASCCI